jgi:hypothetical protein
MPDPEFQPTDAPNAIMAAFHKANETVSRVHQAQSKLMLLMLDICKLPGSGVAKARAIEIGEILGLPASTWDTL